MWPEKETLLEVFFESIRVLVILLLHVISYGDGSCAPVAFRFVPFGLAACGKWKQHQPYETYDTILRMKPIEFWFFEFRTLAWNFGMIYSISVLNEHAMDFEITRQQFRICFISSLEELLVVIIFTVIMLLLLENSSFCCFLSSLLLFRLFVLLFACLILHTAY